MFPAKPKPKLCALCKKAVEPIEDKLTVEKHLVHKKCFKCAICDTTLLPGNCSLDDKIYQWFGPLWFCPAHMMLGSGEKYERLKQRYGDPEAQKA
ncbi:LIM domain-containing protein [Ditylenchus destructor]|uniref:LIM domain-containing protein n=1 Tax=Ditylenchus destructor TaxID=166010 RepID=A0AAD4MR87_9BILA|nr:LIM domain-containing protein [Ditylenchus destructor]